MGRIEKTVFISYRRTDESWALAVFGDLTQHGYDVFIDYEGLASGNFETAILENIGAQAHFLVLLTPKALERCGDPEDWMRREIEAAIDCQRNIVPLMLEGFSFSTPAIASQLTGKLEVLKKYNGLRIPEGYFRHAMEDLRNRFLNVPVDAELHSASVSAQQAATERKIKATRAADEQRNRIEQDWGLAKGAVGVAAKAEEAARSEKQRARHEAISAASIQAGLVGLSPEHIAKELAHADEAKAELTELEGQAEAAREAEDRRRREAETWASANAAGTVAALGAFLKEWPKSEHANEARKRIDAEDRRRREAETWASANAAGTVAALGAFVSRWPNGEHANEARARIKQIKKPLLTFLLWILAFIVIFVLIASAISK
jgi:hypothetical protein